MKNAVLYCVCTLQGTFTSIVCCNKFYSSFQKTVFAYIDFLYCYLVFNFNDFWSNIYYFFSYYFLGLNFSSFSNFLRLKIKLLTLDLSLFKYMHPKL